MFCAPSVHCVFCEEETTFLQVDSEEHINGICLQGTETGV